MDVARWDSSVAQLDQRATWGSQGQLPASRAQGRDHAGVHEQVGSGDGGGVGPEERQ